MAEFRLKSPAPVALEYAEDVNRRVYGRKAPVRNAFVETLDTGSPHDPVLARILRGGQGGAVRLKLLLSMLWFAAAPPHDTEYPARGWAALLGLDQHETNGARRITAAIDWLEENDLVEVQRKPGVPSKVFLRDERGSGQPYAVPYLRYKQKIDAEEMPEADDLWVTLPAAFWTNGWISILTGPAVAMLLVMIREAAYSGRTKRLWHSPRQAKQRFGLSEDTRSAGLRELVEYGILDKTTAPVSPGVFDMKRRRNVYDLHIEQLFVLPGQPRPAKEVKVEDIEARDEQLPEVSGEQAGVEQAGVEQAGVEHVGDAETSPAAEPAAVPSAP